MEIVKQGTPEDLSCEFIIGASESSLLSWLVPFIENAGYKWTSKTRRNESAIEVKIEKSHVICE